MATILMIMMVFGQEFCIVYIDLPMASKSDSVSSYELFMVKNFFLFFFIFFLILL